jgi:putative chitinase
MTSDARFFDSVRAGLLGPTLSDDEVSGCTAILRELAAAPLAYCSYALGTTYKETAHTMRPIDEHGGDAYFFRRYDPRGNNPAIAKSLGNTQPGDGVRYHGRGLVQLTGRDLYTRVGQRIGIDLVNHPERALEDAIAARIMREGMTRGLFTGRSFATYLPMAGPATLAQYGQARRIINGTDCKDEIAVYAKQFEKALIAGGWS